MMKPWNHIESVLDAVLEADPTEWPALAKQACGDDEDLLREVEELLGRVPDIQNFLQTSVSETLFEKAAGKPEPVPEKEIHHIERYRIIRELARGGMGRVFLAERADGQFEHQVALKLLRSSLDSDHIRRRFRAERQILASLNHDNIARLFDGGITDEGRPYIVMEFIEGEPIDQYCDNRQLTINQRLELFISVCEAVQYAHRKLVVHRDLKPSNIWVTHDGVVKLLDFGIAKVLGPGEQPEADPPLTQTGLLPLTPAYASPEQIRNEEITTASDVYQLGMVLCELLTGSRPYEISGKSPGEIEQVICEQPPARPSVLLSKPDPSSQDSDSKNRMLHISQVRKMTTPDQLSKHLRGDLDTIVMKALRKEPDRRYESAGQLAEDIRRYLSGRPVEAHPDSWLYRTGKFGHRHKHALVAIIIVLIGVTGLVAYYTWQLTQERDFAQLEAEKSEQVSTFLADMFKSADPGEARGEIITARELLDRGTERIDELAGHPEVQAGMMDVIGQVYLNLGFYEEARPMLEQALELRSRLYGDIHPETAQSYVHLATVLHDLGNYHEAIPHFEKAMEIFRMIPGHISPEYAATLGFAGSIEQARRNVEAAMALRQEALEMRLKLFGPDHPEIASSYNDIGILHRQQNNFEDAETAYREALRIVRLHEMGNSVLLAQVLSNLGSVLTLKGAFDEAEERLLESLQIRQHIYGNKHRNTALVLQSIANLDHRRGEFTSAERLYEECISILREVMGKSHPQVAQVLVDQGELYMQTDNYPQAERTFREALTMYEETLSEGHTHIVSTRRRLGSSLVRTGQHEEAEILLLESLAGARQLVAENETFHSYQYSLRAALEELVTLYEKLGNPEMADHYNHQLSENVHNE